MKSFTHGICFEDKIMSAENETKKIVAEFIFLTNKSFLGRGNPITIPSRFYAILKENGISETTPAKIRFANGKQIMGFVRVGWRAGGKYYQIRLSTYENDFISNIKLGVKLSVLLINKEGDWFVDLR